MARIVVKVPIGALQPLRQHVDALGTTLSARARELLLADLEQSAPPTVPAKEMETTE